MTGEDVKYKVEQQQQKKKHINFQEIKKTETETI